MRQLKSCFFNKVAFKNNKPVLYYTLVMFVPKSGDEHFNIYVLSDNVEGLSKVRQSYSISMAVFAGSCFPA